MFILIEIQLEKKGKKTIIIIENVFQVDNNDQNYDAYLSVIILFFGYNCKNYYFFRSWNSANLCRKYL